MRATKEATDIDLARLAAMIDCDGTITISSSSKNEPKYHGLQLAVGNCDHRLLEWCKHHFGGFIYPVFYEKKLENRSDINRWRLHSHEAADLLKRCLPYFIAKREQAEVAIAFQNTFGPKRRRLTPELRQIREEYRLKLEALINSVAKGATSQLTDECKRLG